MTPGCDLIELQFRSGTQRVKGPKPEIRLGGFNILSFGAPENVWGGFRAEGALTFSAKEYRSVSQPLSGLSASVCLSVRIVFGA